MKIRATLIISLVILAGANVFIHAKNRSLQQDITRQENQCDTWLEKLALREPLKPRVETRTQTIKLPAAKPANPFEDIPEETDIEQLVSHSHRMQAVFHKYEFLILSAQIEADEKELLKKLLLRRERLSNQLVVAEQGEQVGNIDDIEDKLYNIEDQIELVLHDPLDYHRYELIKQSQL